VSCIWDQFLFRAEPYPWIPYPAPDDLDPPEIDKRDPVGSGLPLALEKSYFSAALSRGNITKSLTVEQRARIITECVEGQISPMELARRYNVNADTIRAWVRKSGRTLPKTYRKLGSGEGGGASPHIRPSSPSLGGVGGSSSGQG
jgi:hypothetical protein